MSKTYSPSAGYVKDENGSPATGNPKRANNRVSAIIPCTLNQLNILPANSDRSGVMLSDDVTIHQYSVVGAIVNVESQETSSVFLIDDGSATSSGVPIKLWKASNDVNPLEREFIDSLLPGSYVRVVGYLQFYQQNRNFIAHSVRPVQDHNEITAHLLEVVKIRLMMQKGLSLSGQSQMKSESSNQYSSYNDTYYASSSGVSAETETLLRTLRLFPNELQSGGVPVNQIVAEMGLPEPEVRRIIAKALQDGEVYSGLDEDHYSCAY